MKKFWLTVCTAVFLFGACQNEVLKPGMESRQKQGNTEEEMVSLDLQAVEARYGDRIALSWNKIEGARRYNIYYQNSNTAQFTEIQTAVTGSSWEHVTGNDSAPAWYYMVKAVSPEGEVLDTSEVVKGSRIGSAVLEKRGRETFYSAVLRWNRPENAAGFVLERKVDGSGDDFAPVAGTPESPLPVTTLEYTDNTVEPSTGYQYRIRTFSQSLSVEYSNTGDAFLIQIPQQTAPGQPQNLHISNMEYGEKIELSWDEPALPEDETRDLIYYLKKKTSSETAPDNAPEEPALSARSAGIMASAGEPPTETRKKLDSEDLIITPGTPAVISYTDTNVESNKLYEYSVFAVYENEDQKNPAFEDYGQPTEPVTGRVIPTVTGFQAAASEDAGTVEISWDVHPSFEGTIEIHKAAGSSGYTLLHEESAADSTGIYTDTEVSSDTPYSYKTRYVTAAEHPVPSAFSLPADVVVPGAFEAFELTATRTDSSIIVLEWPETPGAIYSVQILDNGDWSNLPSSAYTIPAAASGQVRSDITPPGPGVYTYRVEADYAGNLIRSLSADGSILGVPANLSASEGLFAGYVKLTWDAVANATGYRIYYKLKSDSDWETPEDDYELKPDDIISGGQDTVRVTYDFEPPGNDNPAGRGKWYDFKISALYKDADENLTAGTQSHPAAGCALGPALLNLSATHARYIDKIDLKWDRIAGADTYTVSRDDGEGGPFKELATVEERHYTDEDVDPGIAKSYRYQITVLNSSVYTNKASVPVTGNILGAPQNIAASRYTGARSINVSWDPVQTDSGTVTYSVYARAPMDSVWEEVAAGLSSTEYECAVPAGAVKEFTVDAQKGSLKTQLEKDDYTISGAAMSTVTGVSVSKGEAHTADGRPATRISWNRLPGAVRYAVFRMDRNMTENNGNYWRRIADLPANDNPQMEYFDPDGTILREYRHAYWVVGIGRDINAASFADVSLNGDWSGGQGNYPDHRTVTESASFDAIAASDFNVDYGYRNITEREFLNLANGAIWMGTHQKKNLTCNGGNIDYRVYSRWWTDRDYYFKINNYFSPGLEDVVIIGHSSRELRYNISGTWFKYDNGNRKINIETPLGNGWIRLNGEVKEDFSSGSFTVNFGGQEITVDENSNSGTAGRDNPHSAPIYLDSYETAFSKVYGGIW